VTEGGLVAEGGLMADGLTATVVGGGIAGLASAVSLAQAGWRVTVLERAPPRTTSSCAPPNSARPCRPARARRPFSAATGG